MRIITYYVKLGRQWRGSLRSRVLTTAYANVVRSRSESQEDAPTVEMAYREGANRPERRTSKSRDHSPRGCLPTLLADDELTSYVVAARNRKCTNDLHRFGRLRRCLNCHVPHLAFVQITLAFCNMLPFDDPRLARALAGFAVRPGLQFSQSQPERRSCEAGRPPARLDGAERGQTGRD